MRRLFSVSRLEGVLARTERTVGSLSEEFLLNGPHIGCRCFCLGFFNIRPKFGELFLSRLGLVHVTGVPTMELGSCRLVSAMYPLGCEIIFIHILINEETLLSVGHASDDSQRRCNRVSAHFNFYLFKSNRYKLSHIQLIFRTLPRGFGVLGF